MTLYQIPDLLAIFTLNFWALLNYPCLDFPYGSFYYNLSHSHHKLHNWINYYMDTEVDREDDDEFNPELLKATSY